MCVDLDERTVKTWDPMRAVHGQEDLPDHFQSICRGMGVESSEWRHSYAIFSAIIPDRTDTGECVVKTLGCILKDELVRPDLVSLFVLS